MLRMWGKGGSHHSTPACPFEQSNFKQHKGGGGLTNPTPCNHHRENHVNKKQTYGGVGDLTIPTSLYRPFANIKYHHIDAKVSPLPNSPKCPVKPFSKQRKHRDVGSHWPHSLK